MKNQHQPFVIITYPRSGTHMLRTALDGHPNICCNGELFNPNKADLPYPHTQAVSAILKEHAFGDQSHAIQASGFVHHAYHPGVQQTWPDNKTNPVWESIWETLTNIKNLKLIHLYRKNLLWRHLSQVTARQTGHWQTFATPEVAAQQGKPYQPKPGQRPSIMLDAELMQQDFKETLEHRKRIETLFSQHAILAIAYEDLCNDFPGKIGSILNFLGVSQCSLTPQLVKLEDRKMSQAIQNYAELKAIFSNSEFAEFFIE